MRIRLPTLHLRSLPYNACILGVLLTAFAAPPIMNLVFDPAGVFNGPRDGLGLLANERHIKFEVLQHRPRPDGVLLGSSRSGLLPLGPEQVPHAQSWYNLGFLGGTPRDAELFLSALSERHRLPQRLLLGLDLHGFVLGEAQPVRRHHPAVSHEPLMRWYLRNLFNFPGSTFVARFLEPSGAEPDLIHNFRTDGSYVVPRFDALIAQDHEAYKNARVRLANLPSRPYRIDPIQLESLRSLRDIATQNGSTICVFWHPHRPVEVNAYPSSDIEAIKAYVSDIFPDVIDMMSMDFTTNEDLWYDAKHLRSEYGALVTRPLFDSCFAQHSDRVADGSM